MKFIKAKLSFLYSIISIPFIRTAQFDNQARPESINIAANTIRMILQWTVGLASFLALVFLLIAIFTFLISGGTEERIEAAKTAFGRFLLGVVVVILGFAALKGIDNFFSTSSLFAMFGR